MCVCTYICMYACMYVCMHDLCMCVCMYASMPASMISYSCMYGFSCTVRVCSHRKQCPGELYMERRSAADSVLRGTNVLLVRRDHRVSSAFFLNTDGGKAEQKAGPSGRSRFRFWGGRNTGCVHHAGSHGRSRR
jgi:hypothetical protein